MYLKNKIRLLPFLMALLIIPVTVRLSAVQIPFGVQLQWTGTNVDYDFFSYAKSVLTIITGVGTALLLFFLVTFDDVKWIKRGKVFFGVIAFMALMAIVSTFFGGHKEISFGGAPSRYEGLYTYIGYFIICVYAILFDYDERAQKIITAILAIFTVLCAIVGLTQFLGKDFFMSDFGMKLIIPEALSDLRSSIQATQSAFKTMYIFTSHYNYSSMLVGMLFMFWFSFFLATNEKKIKVLALAMAALSVLMLLGANARSGIVAVVGSILVTFLIHFKHIISNKKILISAALFLILAVLVAGKLGLMSRFSDLISDIGKIDTARQESQDYIKDLIPLKDVSTTDSTYSITWKDDQNDFTLNYDKNKQRFYDAQGKTVDFDSPSQGQIQFKDPRYKNVSVTVVSQKFTQNDPPRNINIVKIGSDSFNFDVTEKVKQVNHIGIEIDPNQDFDRAGLYGFEKLGSGRGYIIAYTLPLLKKATIFGYGPDSFLQIFNQDDIYTKLYVYGMTSHIVDKPHNLYLLYAINFGVFATLAFVFMIGYTIVKSAKKYKDADISRYAMAVGSLSAVVAYMISGFFNDSTLSVSTIFFVFLGMSINALIKGE